MQSLRCRHVQNPLKALINAVALPICREDGSSGGCCGHRLGAAVQRCAASHRRWRCCLQPPSQPKHGYPSPLPPALLGCAVCAGLQRGSSGAAAVDPSSLPEVLRPFPGPRLTALPQFGGGHAERLLWGTYRPGFYFGGPGRRAWWRRCSRRCWSCCGTCTPVCTRPQQAGELPAAQVARACLLLPQSLIECWC